MTVLLVLLFVTVFLTIDHFFGRKATVTSAAPALQEASPRPAPAVVAGFELPANLRYHPGHTWALAESPNLVRAGLDDFAAKLSGKLDSITLPKRGQWLRQGQKAWSLIRNGKSVDMVSPIEGTVTDINEAALRDPELARKDPYGEGWLVKVESPDAKINFRNLMNGSLARLWLQTAAQRLRGLTLAPATVGVLAQDGGTAIDNTTEGMHGEAWAALAREFFLS